MVKGWWGGGEGALCGAERCFAGRLFLVSPDCWIFGAVVTFSMED